jgi:uncharacterized membrane protein YgcG
LNVSEVLQEEAQEDKAAKEGQGSTDKEAVKAGLAGGAGSADSDDSANSSSTASTAKAKRVDAYLQAIYSQALPGALVLIVTQPDTAILRRFQRAVLARAEAVKARAAGSSGGSSGSSGSSGASADTSAGSDGGAGVAMEASSSNAPATLAAAMDLIKTGMLFVACKGAGRAE